jgi:hypothetical protein
VPKGQGWFVLNAREAQWWAREGRGLLCEFEGAGFEGALDFEQLGINVTVLGRASRQACTTTRTTRRTSWCSPVKRSRSSKARSDPSGNGTSCTARRGTEHTIIGAGDSGCVLLAVGARDRSVGPDWGSYTVDETAIRHGAGVEAETTDPDVAYERFEPGGLVRYVEGSLPDL